MITTDVEFREEALVFLNKNHRYFDKVYPFDIGYFALDYVGKSSHFKYRDEMEANVLVTCLVDFGLIAFSKTENGKQYHILTQKGLEYVEDRGRKK